MHDWLRCRDFMDCASARRATITELIIFNPSRAEDVSLPATKILWGQILVVSLVVLAATWAATQWTAWRLGYADVLGRETGQTIEPAKLIAPMLARFMSTDRAFARSRRARRGTDQSDRALLRPPKRES
jgi:hypothetical protein